MVPKKDLIPIMIEGTKICTHCGATKGIVENDHIPPKSFFPKPRPSNLITVPSCSKCNRDPGKDEEYFLATLMFGNAGVSPTGKKLWNEKLHRMYQKNKGLKKIIAKNLRAIELNTPQGIYLGKQMAITYDESRLSKVVQKIVRGLYFFEHDEIFAKENPIKTKFLRTQQDIDYLAEKCASLPYGKRQWSDIFEYRCGRVEEAKEMSIWILRFFGKNCFWALTDTKPD